MWINVSLVSRRKDLSTINKDEMTKNRTCERFIHFIHINCEQIQKVIHNKNEQMFCNFGLILSNLVKKLDFETDFLLSETNVK